MQTHAGHSIAFKCFWTLWPCDLGPNINWWTKPRDGISLWQVLVIEVSAVLVLSCGQTHTHTHTHRHTDKMSSAFYETVAVTLSHVLYTYSLALRGLNFINRVMSQTTNCKRGLRRRSLASKLHLRRATASSTISLNDAIRHATTINSVLSI